MRLPSIPPGSGMFPLWPPLLATRGPGSRSELHAHHALHLILAIDGNLAVRTSARAPWSPAAGILTAPDTPHAVDATGRDVLLVFLDPESTAGQALIGSPLRLLTAAERDALVADPLAIMQADTWPRHAVTTLGGPPAPPSPMHPRVRKLLRLLQAPGTPVSLDALAAAVDLSPGRLMHVFTDSIGIPLRPYLTWLKLQRAASAISTGAALTDAAHRAGFADSAHMTRTFRRMFGVTPSTLRPATRTRRAASAS